MPNYPPPPPPPVPGQDYDAARMLRQVPPESPRLPRDAIGQDATYHYYPPGPPGNQPNIHHHVHHPAGTDNNLSTENTSIYQRPPPPPPQVPAHEQPPAGVNTGSYYYANPPAGRPYSYQHPCQPPSYPLPGAGTPSEQNAATYQQQSIGSPAFSYQQYAPAAVQNDEHATPQSSPYRQYVAYSPVSGSSWQHQTVAGPGVYSPQGGNPPPSSGTTPNPGAQSSGLPTASSHSVPPPQSYATEATSKASPLPASPVPDGGERAENLPHQPLQESNSITAQLEHQTQSSQPTHEARSCQTQTDAGQESATNIRHAVPGMKESSSSGAETSSDPGAECSDPLVNLSAKMGDLGIEAAEGQSTGPESEPPAQDNFDAPIILREIRDSGEPLVDVQFCPGPRAVNYSLKWYYITELPDDVRPILICSRCYVDSIQSTSLSDQFSCEVFPSGIPLGCSFGAPRIKKVLWPRAVRTNSLSELRIFIAKIESLQSCPGSETITGIKGTAWYGILDNPIEGFNVCEQCFEYYISGSSFANKFGCYEEPAEEHTWTCHLKGGVFGRIAAKLSEQDNWQAFLVAALVMPGLPKCEGNEIRSDSGTWYIPKISSTAKDAQICATCYQRWLAYTPFAGEFRRHSPEFDTTTPGLWRCSLASVSAMMALESALDQHDFATFAEPLNRIVQSPRCLKTGIVDGVWLTLAGGGCPEFAICYACFAGIFWTRGLHSFLEQAAGPPGEAIVCSLHPAHVRFGQYLAKLHEAVDRGVFGYFSDYVRKISGVRVCASNGALPNMRWWGYPESYFCEDCYLTFVKDTKLGEALPLNGDVVEATTFCQIWSPRMRKYWQEVCESGEPGSAESDEAVLLFRAISKHRHETYFKTLSEIEFMKQMKGVQQQQAMFQGLMSVTYQGMDNFAQTTNITGDYKYGSTSMGWYATKYGVEARQRMDAFSTGLRDSIFSASEIQRVLALQAAWKEVE